MPDTATTGQILLDVAVILAAAFNVNFSAVCVDQRLRDREAQAEPSKTSCNFGLSLFERVENFVDFFLFNADPCVDDANLDFVRRRVERFDNDSAFFGRKFHAVLN